MDKKILKLWLLFLVVLPVVILVTYFLIKPFVTIPVRQAVITIETMILYIGASVLFVKNYEKTDEQYNSR